MTRTTAIPFALDRDARVLVVAAHPDDETLGCGGTIARLAAAGLEIAVLAVTVGPLRHGISDPTRRRGEFTDACAQLGVATAHLAWPDDTGDLDITHSGRRLVDLLEHDTAVSLVRFHPAAVLIPAAGAFHQDHHAVHLAAFAAARPRPTGGPPAPRVVAGYHGPEDVGWTRVQERWPIQVDISDHWTVKKKALRCYPSQIPDEGHPRAINHIEATDRAAGRPIGVAYAETFTLYRMVC
jgi:LmbE family N-acetylglucosaminyl deacetylase